MELDRPNILFINLDTVRAKNTSAYGYQRDTTPFLEGFSEESIKYNRAYAPAPWTTPSHASMFTGTHVTTHKTNRKNERLTPDFPTLAELLQQNGYDTVGFSNNGHVSPHFDFDRGFNNFVFNRESYSEPLDGGVSVSQIRRNTGEGPFHQQAVEALQYIRKENASLSKTFFNWLYRKASEAELISQKDRGAESTNQFVKQYLADEPQQPFFMYLNYMEAHAPYRSPKDYLYRYNADPLVSNWWPQTDYFSHSVEAQDQKVSDLMDQYDGCIRYLDFMIENLIDLFVEFDLFDDTIVVIVSDHGEAFGEWELYEHKAGVYDELTHVPLLINTPEDRTETRNRPVSCRWLYPTLLRRAGVEVPEHAVDTDLVDPIDEPVLIESEGLPYDEHIYESGTPRKFSSWHYGYVDEEHKFIKYDADNSAELYKVTDESEDLVAEQENVAKNLNNQLDAMLSTVTSPDRSDSNQEVEVSDEVVEHLQELGYK